MKRAKIFCTLFFFVTACISCYGVKSKNDSDAIIKIKIKEFRNQPWGYITAIPGEYFEIKLNSQGEASIHLPIKKRSFIIFLADKNVPYTVLLEPGDNMIFSVVKGKTIFSGSNSKINNFLFKPHAILSQLDDSLSSIKDPLLELDKFIRFCNYCDSKLSSLFEQYSDSLFPGKNLNYILRDNMLAYVLLKKEELLRFKFTTKEIDSLKLVNKLGLTNHPSLKDTVLIEYPSPFYTGYLNTMLIRHFNEIATPRGFSDITSIESDSQYSQHIKMYLLFHSLFQDIIDNGPSVTVDSIANRLKEKYSEFSYFYSFLEYKQKLLDYLMPGSRAPHLQGISPENKMYSLNDFKGKIVFVDIWATWCAPCIEALPRNLELEKKFKDEKEVVFIFLAHDNETDWKKYLSEHPEFIGLHLRSRPKEDLPFEKKWKITSIPRYLIIDKQGNIIDAFAKNTNSNGFEEIIKKILLK